MSISKSNIITKKANVPSISDKRFVQEIKNTPNDNDDKMWFIGTLNVIEAIECIMGP